MNRSRVKSEPGVGIEGQWGSLSFRDGRGWSFLGGDWTQDDDGLITPPGNNGRDLLAVAIDQTYSDLEAEFDFR